MFQRSPDVGQRPWRRTWAGVGGRGRMIQQPAMRGWFSADVEAPERLEFDHAEVCVFTRCAPGKESGNEDAAMVLTAPCGALVLAVADGVGGGRGGAEAARLALETLAGRIATVVAGGDELRAAMVSGIEDANEAILERGIGSATTLVAATVEDAVVRAYHAGDSELVVVGQRGRVKLKTVSHSPVGYAVEAGLLDADEALHHADRNLVSNVLGTAGLRIEVGSPLRLAARDTIALGSDGLFDNLSGAEIVELVRKGPLSRCAAALVDAASRRMEAPEEGAPSKIDDLTFILMRRRGR